MWPGPFPNFSGGTWGGSYIQQSQIKTFNLRFCLTLLEKRTVKQTLIYRTLECNSPYMVSNEHNHNNWSWIKLWKIGHWYHSVPRSLNEANKLPSSASSLRTHTCYMVTCIQLQKLRQPSQGCLKLNFLSLRLPHFCGEGNINIHCYWLPYPPNAHQLG